MSNDTAVTPSLNPHLTVAGAAEAIDFYGRAFGATEMIRLPGPDGKLVHAAVEINGTMVLLVDENEEWGLRGPKLLGGSPVTIHLTVPDVDAAVAQAVAAGATVTMEVADQFWGDRFGSITDPFGHSWSIATHVEDVPPEEMAERAKEAMAAMSSS